jgi:hypothetical protein
MQFLSLKDCLFFVSVHRSFVAMLQAFMVCSVKTFTVRFGSSSIGQIVLEILHPNP